MSLAIAAIVKDEAPYILEWIAHHKSLGFDFFFIADNGSTDGTWEILQGLEAEGIVRAIKFTTDSSIAPQCPAYEYIFSEFGHLCEWIAFIDADEFFVPYLSDFKFSEYFSSVDSNVGAIVVNWAIYGSSYLENSDSSRVASKFVRRADKRYVNNHHYKTIVRSEAFLSSGGNPHQFVINSLYKTVNVSGERLSFHPQRGGGLSETVVWSPFRLNHYVVKSYAEFLAKKTKRGSAAKVGRVKGRSYFVGHDQNIIYDPMPEYLLERSEVEMRRLSALIAPLGEGFSFEEIADAPLRSQPIGCIDSLSVDGTLLVVTGWAVGRYGLGVSDFIVTLDGSPLLLHRVVRLNRPDVARLHAGSIWDSGYKIFISLLSSPILPKTGSVLGLGCRVDGRMVSVAQRSIDESIAKKFDFLHINIPSVPSMPDVAVEKLVEFLKRSRCYLEYGTGGSTMLASSLGVEHIFCVESDAAWLFSVKTSVEKHTTSSDVNYVHIDIGATGAWGYPNSDSKWRNWYKYAVEPWKLLSELGRRPDLVLIDGRFRSACLLASVIFSAPGTVLLFDDYGDREYYKDVEDIIEPKKYFGRMAMFVNEGVRDPEYIWLRLMELCQDVR